MDDEHLYQEDYFEAFCSVIDGLDPKAADFDFMFRNLTIGAQQSPFLNEDERKKIKAMLHLVRTRVKQSGQP